MTNNKKGFTLIELLIVISIVVILSAVGMANFRTGILKARDARRISEIKQIRSALEFYRTDAKVYPSSLPGCKAPLQVMSGGTKYILMPCDPSEDTPYGYKSTDYSYVIGAELESLERDDGANCGALIGFNYCETDID